MSLVIRTHHFWIWDPDARQSWFGYRRKGLGQLSRKNIKIRKKLHFGPRYGGVKFLNFFSVTPLGVEGGRTMFFYFRSWKFRGCSIYFGHQVPFVFSYAHFYVSRKVINETGITTLADRKKVGSFCMGGPTHGVQIRHKNLHRKTLENTWGPKYMEHRSYSTASGVLWMIQDSAIAL